MVVLKNKIRVDNTDTLTVSETVNSALSRGVIKNADSLENIESLLELLNLRFEEAFKTGITKGDI